MTGIAARLKDSTTQVHKEAEQSPFQRLLVSGRVPKPLYIEWLAQQWAVYCLLEERLHGQASPLLQEPWRRREALEADLAHFGSAPAPRELRATRRFLAHLDRLHQENPAALLGVLYVLEGSTNGSRYIARNIRRAFGLEQAGTAFLDPHGEEQPARWARFRELLNQSVRPEEEDAVLAAAHATFAAVTAMGEELLGEERGARNEERGASDEERVAGTASRA